MFISININVGQGIDESIAAILHFRNQWPFCGHRRHDVTQSHVIIEFSKRRNKQGRRVVSINFPSITLDGEVHPVIICHESEKSLQTNNDKIRIITSHVVAFLG